MGEMASGHRVESRSRVGEGLTRRALTVVTDGARKFAGALTTPLIPSDFLELVAPLHLSADLRGRIEAVDRRTPGSTRLVIRPGRGWETPVPGQYIRIGVDVDGIRLWRAYSLTGPVGADTISIAVRAIPEGKVSNYLNTKAAAGQLIHLDQATGDFVVPDLAPASALFFTAGSGITPVMGILRNRTDLDDIVVVHSAPSATEMMFRDELRQLAAAGRIRLIERITGQGAREVRLPAHRIGDVVPDWKQRETWACGPIGLMDDVEEHWASHGLSERLHVERFRVGTAEIGEGGEIDFSTSAVKTLTDGATTILDAGEAAGVLMPSGCRMGICFNCVLPMQEGSVRDLRTGEVTTAFPEDPVLIQTCISAAAGACQITH